jgi:hypothetical protein
MSIDRVAALEAETIALNRLSEEDKVRPGSSDSDMGIIAKHGFTQASMRTNERDYEVWTADPHFSAHLDETVARVLRESNEKWDRQIEGLNPLPINSSPSHPEVQRIQDQLRHVKNTTFPNDSRGMRDNLEVVRRKSSPVWSARFSQRKIRLSTRSFADGS